MIAMLLFAGFQASAPVSAEPEPYAGCLRYQAENVADDAAEDAWAVAWQRTLERCRTNRQAWLAYYSRKPAYFRDALNVVELWLPRTEAESYQGYRHPVRMGPVAVDPIIRN